MKKNYQPTPQVAWTGPTKEDVARMNDAADKADAACEAYCALYEAKQRGEQVTDAELAAAKKKAERAMGEVP